MTVSDSMTATVAGHAGNPRIIEAFARSRAEGRTAVIPFVTAGYPTIERSEEWALAMIRGGADLIEIGVPFSDPLADGATVQRTSQVALQNGTTLGDALEMTRRLRSNHGVTIPILLMGYVNPILRYGIERLAADSAAAGVDGFIVPDLPAEESDELLVPLRKRGLDLIFFLAPTSTPERIASVAQRATGFIYCVSITGVTGARANLPDLEQYIGSIRARTDTPIAIGFGVSTPDHVKQIGNVADGAVVASALINFLDTVPASAQAGAAEQFIRGLRGEEAFPNVSTQTISGPTSGAGSRASAGVNPETSEAAPMQPRMVACRGVRGATTIEANTSEDILEATTDLLDAQDQGSPFSEQATIDERFSLDEASGKKILTYQATITDPVYYTEPVKLPDRKYQLYDGFIIPYGCQDELWYELLDLRRDQLKAGKPVEARMSDVYKVREARE